MEGQFKENVRTHEECSLILFRVRRVPVDHVIGTPLFWFDPYLLRAHAISVAISTARI